MDASVIQSICLHDPETRSRIVWLGRNVSTRRGVIGTSIPVFGFRPTRSRLSRSTKVPKPEILTFSPLIRASDTCCRTCSTSTAESDLDRPTFRLSSSARSARVSVESAVILPPHICCLPAPTVTDTTSVRQIETICNSMWRKTGISAPKWYIVNR
jgi:hypothetical protein